MVKTTTLSKIISKNSQPISTASMLYGIVITSMVAIPTILLINKYAYDDNGKLVCDDYVLNSYLFTALGFCYIAIGVILEQKLQIIPKVPTYVGIFGFFFIYLSIMFLLFIKIRKTNPNKTIEINAYYALACILLGTILSVTIMMGVSTNVIYPAIAVTIGLTFIMGYIGYKYGASFITVDFDKYLRFALFGLIIWSFMAIFIFKRYIKTLFLAVSIPGAIIFCLLLMSYNNNLRKNAEKCKIPNYPDEAIGLVIKIGNLLADIIRIMVALKGKRNRSGGLVLRS
jgi:hypothetical protein